jgi:tetratricopeptide (TPR) repeat protein
MWVSARSWTSASAASVAASRAVVCAVRLAHFDWKGAEAAGRRAIELDPSFLFGWTWLSLSLSGMGRFDEAITAAESAVPMDPLSPMGWTMAGWAMSAGRRFAEAEQPLRRALELSATHGLALWNLGIALVGLGRHDEAVALLERAHEGEPAGASLILGILAWTEAAAGRKEKAHHHLDELREWAKYRHVPRYPVAWALAALGDRDHALDEFERAVEERETFLQYPLFPGYDPLRSEPRFQRALRSLGLGWAVERLA